MYYYLKVCVIMNNTNSNSLNSVIVIIISVIIVVIIRPEDTLMKRFGPRHRSTDCSKTNHPNPEEKQLPKFLLKLFPLRACG